MNRTFVMRGVLAVIVLQVVILVAEYLNSVYPLWVGEEVKLKTIPVDPRSLFRGNYALLNYEIDNVSFGAINQSELRNHTPLYVLLEKREDGLHHASGLSLTKPESGTFIRGVYQERAWNTKINFGIEAYFAPKQRALDLESDLRHGGVALVMVAGNGKAALKDVIPNPTESPQKQN